MYEDFAGSNAVAGLAHALNLVIPVSTSTKCKPLECMRRMCSSTMAPNWSFESSCTLCQRTRSISGRRGIPAHVTLTECGGNGTAEHVAVLCTMRTGSGLLVAEHLIHTDALKVVFLAAAASVRQRLGMRLLRMLLKRTAQPQHINSGSFCCAAQHLSVANARRHAQLWRVFTGLFMPLGVIT